MKTVKWIPILLLGINLGFMQQAQSQNGFDAGTSDVSLFGETCTMAVTASVSRDGIEFSNKTLHYRFTFCPNNNLTITNAYTGYTTTGFWSADMATNRVKIEVSGKDPEGGYFGDFSAWLNGEWGIMEHSADVLELNRFFPSAGLSDNGVSWIVRFQAKMRETSTSGEK